MIQYFLTFDENNVFFVLNNLKKMNFSMYHFIFEDFIMEKLSLKLKHCMKCFLLWL